MQVAFVGVESTSNTVSVGTEMSYTIDASASYDIDYPSSQSMFSFVWDCPGLMTCSGTGPRLTITKQMRQTASLNGIGSTFAVQVQIYSPYKKSSIVGLNIVIERQNISQCISLQAANSD